MNIPIPHIQPLSETAILLKWEPKIDTLFHQQMLYLGTLLEIEWADFLLECIPSYHTLTLIFSTEKDIINRLNYVEESIKNFISLPVKMEEIELKKNPVEIPVNYGGVYGPDLINLSKLKQLSVSTLIELHTEPIYYVYMIGFIGGFPYLGGLNHLLHTPRRGTPRTHVPAGSVGIGGEQTGIYPFAAPGGWNIIGNTSFRLFDAEKSPYATLKAGDRVRFTCEEVFV